MSTTKWCKKKVCTDIQNGVDNWSESTCLSCVKAARKALPDNIYVKNRLDELIYKRDFDKLINEEPNGEEEV